MARSTVHYADNATNNILKRLHNKLRPAGTPVQRVEYIIELLLLRIFEVKLKHDPEFKKLRKVFTGENENLLFSSLYSLPNEQIISALNSKFFPFYSHITSELRKVSSENPSTKVQDQLVLIDEVFSNSNFTNNVNSGNVREVVGLVGELDEDRLLKTDLLGDAIESALSETGGTKDIGLFRTPDHIRQFMVGLVMPTFADHIFDPTCGTGGFLFDASEYVIESVRKNGAWPGPKAHPELAAWFKEHFAKLKAPMPTHEVSTDFYRQGVMGIEYLGMIRKMAAINFYIRGLNPGNILQGDSLAMFKRDFLPESKSAILANPPFGAERDQDAYPDVWAEYPKESETTILFVKLMLETLKKAGRCAVVVSEGFMTWDQNSARALRKALLDDADLKAIISLPQGVFVSKGGQGPKTSILYFEKGGPTRHVWFYKVTDDGYTMGTNRKQVAGCQFVEALDLFHRYVRHGKLPPDTRHSFTVPAEWIKTLDPRSKERIRTETRVELTAKAEEERTKLAESLANRQEDGKFTAVEVEERLAQHAEAWQHRIHNEIAKRIDRAHLYSFNLPNHRSNLTDEQIEAWHSHVKVVRERTQLDIRYDKLKRAKPAELDDTMLYQQSYTLTPEEQADFPGSKTIKPDFVLQDMQASVLAVIENKLDDPKKALPKLRLKYSRILKPRYLYACAQDKMLFYDMSWRGVDAGEFRPVNEFMSLEQMKTGIAKQREKAREREIVIDKNIAGGFDPAAGKDRYFQTECIRTLIEGYRTGKMKMLVHMATGLGKTRMTVALAKALLEYGLAQRILFVVDRRVLARQALEKGFSLISPTYNSTWITSGNFRTHANKSIHVVVIDTLELLFDRIPSNFYDLLVVDECHRSITISRKLIFDHFLCPRIGLTATPRTAIPAEGKEVSEDDVAILDTYRLFGCETGEPDYMFDLARGIDEGFLAPYKVKECITDLTRQAMKEGILYDHLLDPDTRQRIELPEEKKIELERLNKRVLSEEQSKRWAEEIHDNTEYGEKMILFAASQAHALMLVKELNMVFGDQGGEGPRYAEAIISENDDVNDALKAWFEKPYQNPRIVLSVDIMSTGVDIPCVRFIGFGALTKSVGKYIQMLGRGTRLDPKTGKFSFRILDFVGVCKRMGDNGKGTIKPNVKVVTGTGGGDGGGGGGGGISIDGILDNPDPAHLIQRVMVHEGAVKVIDNIPVEQARTIFEEGVKSTTDPLIAELKRKAWEAPDYQPSEEELAAIKRWVNNPEIYLNEGSLQKIYSFPAGSIWDFFLNVLGVRKIPTTTERIEAGFDSYIALYNFTPEQVDVLRKIKDIFASNVTGRGKIDLEAILANPIYERIIGHFAEINAKFDGRLREVVEEMQHNFKVAA